MRAGLIPDDQPGTHATGKTREEAALNMHGAVELHVRRPLKYKLPVPKSQPCAEFIAIAP